MKAKLTNLFLVGLLPVFFLSCKKEASETGKLSTASLKGKTAAAIQTPQTDFTLGIGGELYYREEYSVIPISKQLDIIKGLGLDFYRINLPVSANGSLSSPAPLQELLKAASERKLQILPTLYLRGLDYTLTETVAYEKGKALGLGFATRYGEYFTYYELGYEQENALIVLNAAGTEESDYHAGKFKILAQFLKGVNEGIKAKDITGKTIINARWLHYTYLKMLENAGVAFDIIGYHWFSKYEKDALEQFGITNIADKLSSLFTKPIWFTAVNRTNGSYTNNESDQQEWLVNFINTYRNKPSVKAIFVEGLVDNAAAATPEYRFKGIAKWRTDDSSWTLKSFARYFYKQAPFILGINGHPLNQIAYIQTPLSRQMSFLKSMGMNYYRVDIGTDGLGNIREQKKFNELISVANSSNIQILPTLFLVGLNYLENEVVNYDRGLALGKGFASKYGQYFDYYELGNEYDLKLKPSTADGRYSANYDQTKFKKVAAFMRGLIKGIKKYDITGKTIINGCGWNYGYFELLKQADLDMDIIGHHLYSMSTNQNTNYVNIVKTLAGIFENKKPVFVTELNQENGDYVGSVESQDIVVNDFIDKLKQVPEVKAVFIYELLDQPELIHPKEREKHMGVIKWNLLYTSWSFKPVANTFVRRAAL